MTIPLADPSLRSQEENVLAFLRTGRELDPMNALRMFGTLRLGARVHSLRRQGHDIRTRSVQVGRKRWASYWLANGKD